MPQRMSFNNISIKFSLLIPIVLTILVVFTTTILYLIMDQSRIKNIELKEKTDFLSKLIVMTNINPLWNYLNNSDTLPIDQNLSTFLMDRELVSVTVRDKDGNVVSQFEEELKGKLTDISLNINRENRKIGSIDLVFSDHFIRQEIRTITIQFLLACCVALAVIIPVILVITSFITKPIVKLTRTAASIADDEMNILADVRGQGEVRSLAAAFNSMTTQLRTKTVNIEQTNTFLTGIIGNAKNIITRLNDAAGNIETAAQEQTSASNEYASGITEVSATLQELTSTAKQITHNVENFVSSNEEMTRLLNDNEKEIVSAVVKLEEAGDISRNNSDAIEELGKRSVLINEMVELIKDIANKTNILSINASIEASRSGETGGGFSVVAAEIRELSHETIDSVRNIEKAAIDIREFLKSIIVASGNEVKKVTDSGKTLWAISYNIK